jgi:superoxide dismutase, Fe-Mn family
MQYPVKKFTIPELAGISQESIDLHLGLYAGYVKHVNVIEERIAAYTNDLGANNYAIAEMRRRFGFEFGGMKNHEAYFEQFEGGATPLPESDLKTMIETQFDSVENFITQFKSIAMTRGVGWAMLYFDQEQKRLVTTWVDEQHLGQLPGLTIVLALDMWEHSYMRDYLPADKSKYVDAFFENLNWDVVVRRV